MKNKDVINLLANEGNKIVPSSLDTLKAKIKLTDKYIVETKLKAEANKIVPNDISYIKSQIEIKPEKKRFSLNFKISIATFAAASLAAIIIVPTAVNASNNNYQKGLSNLKVTLASENDDETTLRYDVDANTNILENGVTTLNENAKKLVSGLNSVNNGKETNLSDYTTKLIKFGLNNADKNNSFVLKKNKKYTINVDVFGGSATKDKFINNIKSQLNNVVNSVDDIEIEYTINVNEDMTGDYNEDLLKTRFAILEDLVNRLFLDDDGEIIAGYIPEKVTYKDLTLEQMNNAIEILSDLYEHIPSDEYLKMFREDLKEIHRIYTQRKDELLRLKDYCEQAISLLQGINPSEEIEFNDKFEEPRWWDDVGHDDDLNDFYHKDYPKNDDDIIRDIIFGRHNDKPGEHKEFGHDYEYENAPLQYLKETYDQIISMIEENERWFANAFALLANRDEIADDNGFKPEDEHYEYHWSEDHYWDDDKSYWDNYWK